MLWILIATLGGQGAGAGPAGLCEVAAARAAQQTGVPEPVLRAIALTETGRSLAGAMRPWPWTTHAADEGRWFDSRAAAEAHVRDLRAGGLRSIDIGCFQINFRWHGDAFASPEAMFDPDANALHAARFLASLQSELGSWEAAAGAYHSRTPALAARYTARFRRHLAALDGSVPHADPPSQARSRPPGPLLHAAASPLTGRGAGASAALGSLVPDAAPRGRLINAGARALQ